ncbi:DNA-binding transcriptional regulator, MocR family, contains an aminotransferase domain [Kaistia soli DSM 19436]|uniref:DNA-binding transcriptional regulator, MocR family, contains an aminotransferase domain n=1 Tax=Kaistia soli DSM 19436 TaxID=1122133 RepID=A0A1M4WWB1_9HYPH|nr:PLP-dependent aminotransferase family protein [Kaistia soli]SHE85262.1 DNA-binding transcriptional regulator, MocR family, contains an aminotransferase domain [Kaistia soli DSM 19436]
MSGWKPTVDRSSGPLFRAIVEALAADIAAGRLAAGERLPPQRALAEALSIDFTTVTRAYAEAQRQGLVEARVGRGTFVRRPFKRPPSGRIDLAMNLPPRPSDPRLAARLWQGMAALNETQGLDLLMRYQAPGGTAEDRAAGATFLAPRVPGADPGRVLVAPGAQGALAVVTMHLATRGDVILTDRLTYPGFRALAGRLGITLAGVPADAGGMRPDALEDWAARHAPRALYLNPTLNNPTTITLSSERRKAIAAVARRHDFAIIEDDAYGALPLHPPASFAALAPERTYHVAGLAKCLSPALRIAYLALPDEAVAERLAGSIRALATMASPLTTALATRWITDGTAAALLGAIRSETAALQAIAAARLPSGLLQSDPAAFHAWLTLPVGWTRAAFLGRFQPPGLGLVASDSFALESAPEAVRLGFGAATDRESFEATIDELATLLSRTPGEEMVVI